MGEVGKGAVRAGRQPHRQPCRSHDMDLCYEEFSSIHNHPFSIGTIQCMSVGFATPNIANTMDDELLWEEIYRGPQ